VYPLDCEAPSDSVPVAINSFHHDLGALPDGNFLVLSNRIRDVDDYPTSEDDPDAETKPAQILECLIVEFTREGEIVKSIPTGDLIDPTRIGRDSLATSWASEYVPEGELVYDWDHCNSVHYEASSDSYYVSLRHQDAVLKIARAEETLTWILGNPENWQAPWSDKLLTPVGDLLWPFHQHSAKPNRFGLGMYDNGNYRAAAFQTPETDSYSRAVVYSIDEVERTISQVWEYGPPTGEGSFYSSAMGDADWLPVTDNVLIVSAQMTTGSSAWAQIFEVKQDGTRVFELNVGDHGGEGGEWSEVQTVYRAERIRDIRE
jgi:arylsulfate sulfotransferase